MGGYLVRRRGALGDVICVTPIIRELRRRNPEVRIDIETLAPEVFHHNPHINGVIAENNDPTEYDKVIDLNLAYEKRPNMHIVDAYSLESFDDLNISKELEVYCSPQDAGVGDQHMAKLGFSDGQFLVVHMARTWPNRTLPYRTWRTALLRLAKLNIPILLVGGEKDLFISDIDGVRSLLPPTRLSVLVHLISKAMCIVCLDSALLHLAGATSTPIVCIFTVAESEYRLPYRRGQLGYNTIAIRPTTECYGCLHRVPPPVAYVHCYRGDNICTAQISPDRIVEGVVKVIEDRSNSR